LGDHILRKRIQQVAKQGRRQLPFGDDLGQFVEYGPERCCAAFDASDFFAIVGEPLQTCRVTGVAFVGNVVGAARKTIDGLYRSAQVFGQQQRSDREIFVVIDGHR
jgi:hypothetical protein